jgi:hypothetical protein
LLHSTDGLARRDASSVMEAALPQPVMGRASDMGLHGVWGGATASELRIGLAGQLARWGDGLAAVRRCVAARASCHQPRTVHDRRRRWGG